MWGHAVRRSVWFKPLALAALFGIPVPLYAAVRWDQITAPAVAAPCEVRVAGYRMDEAQPPAATAVTSNPLIRLSRDYLSDTVRIGVGTREVRASRAALGARIDQAHLRALLAALENPSSPLRLVHDQHHSGQTLHVPMPIAVDVRAARTQLLRLKDQIDSPASPPDPHSGRPGKPGRVLHMMRTLLRLRHALRHGQHTVEAVVLDLPYEAPT